MRLGIKAGVIPNIITRDTEPVEPVYNGHRLAVIIVGDLPTINTGSIVTLMTC